MVNCEESGRKSGGGPDCPVCRKSPRPAETDTQKNDDSTPCKNGHLRPRPWAPCERCGAGTCQENDEIGPHAKPAPGDAK